MTQHIGIVACSAEGAARCYRALSAEGAEVMGRHTHPEISLHNYPLSEYVGEFVAGNWEGVAYLLLNSAEKVAAAGADFIICPSNTAHRGFDLIPERFPLPWLHIADIVVEEAVTLGYRKLGILGTRALMEGAVYQSRLDAINLDHLIPDETNRARIDHIIFDELVIGRDSEGTRLYLSHVIDRFGANACDAVILGSTTLPLAISPESSALPLLDSAHLLAVRALRTAVGYL